MASNHFFSYIKSKSILSKLPFVDSWFGITYNMNLYRGCQHGCIYCDTRSYCYGIHDISKIKIKENSIELLSKELNSKRKIRATIGTGSMNDPYMPIEKDICLTQRALETINRNKFPIHVITKSNLIERDIDLLKDIFKTYCAVSFTITTNDDSLAKKIEPYASPTSLRFKAIENLAKQGIYTGITLMPILPFINDNEENLKSIIRKAKDSGASYVLPMFGVTLRQGSRDYFYKALEQNFNNIKEKYEQTYNNQYNCLSVNQKKLQDVFNNETHRLGIYSKMEFYKPYQNSQLSIF